MMTTVRAMLLVATLAFRRCTPYRTVYWKCLLGGGGAPSGSECVRAQGAERARRGRTKEITSDRARLELLGIF